MIKFSESGKDLIFDDVKKSAEFYHNIYNGKLEQIDEILKYVCKNNSQRVIVLMKAIRFIVSAKWENKSGKEYDGVKALTTTKLLLKEYRTLGGKQFFLCDSCRANEVDLEIVGYLYESNNWDKDELKLATWWAKYREGFEDRGHSNIELLLNASPQKIKHVHTFSSQIIS